MSPPKRTCVSKMCYPILSLSACTLILRLQRYKSACASHAHLPGFAGVYSSSVLDSLQEQREWWCQEAGGGGGEGGSTATQTGSNASSEYRSTSHWSVCYRLCLRLSSEDCKSCPTKVCIRPSPNRSAPHCNYQYVGGSNTDAGQPYVVDAAVTPKTTP